MIQTTENSESEGTSVDPETSMLREVRTLQEVIEEGHEKHRVSVRVHSVQIGRNEALQTILTPVSK